MTTSWENFQIHFHLLTFRTLLRKQKNLALLAYQVSKGFFSALKEKTCGIIETSHSQRCYLGKKSWLFNNRIRTRVSNFHPLFPANFSLEWFPFEVSSVGSECYQTLFKQNFVCTMMWSSTMTGKSKPSRANPKIDYRWSFFHTHKIYVSWFFSLLLLYLSNYYYIIIFAY